MKTPVWKQLRPVWLIILSLLLLNPLWAPVKANISCHPALIFPGNPQDALLYFNTYDFNILTCDFMTKATAYGSNAVTVKAFLLWTRVLSHKGASSRFDPRFPFPRPIHSTFVLRLPLYVPFTRSFTLLPLQLYAFHWKHGKGLFYHSGFTFGFCEFFAGIWHWFHERLVVSDMDGATHLDSKLDICVLFLFFCTAFTLYDFFYG